MEKMEKKNKKDLRESFREFLFYLNDFLEVSALIENEKLKVLYIQEPTEALNEMYAKGLIQVGNYMTPVEITFDIDLELVKVDSVIFSYRLTTNQMLQFLEEIKSHGGA